MDRVAQHAVGAHPWQRLLVADHAVVTLTDVALLACPIIGDRVWIAGPVATGAQLRLVAVRQLVGKLLDIAVVGLTLGNVLSP